MRWIGIDPAASKGVAVAWIDDYDGNDWAILPKHDSVGARRLWGIHSEVALLMGDMTRKQVACVVVEIPWSRPPNFALIGSAAVCMLAAQAAVPGAVVMEVPTQNWKAEIGLPGNAGKPRVIEHSRTLGYRGNDEDIADALCMAQVARERWERAVAA